MISELARKTWAEACRRRATHGHCKDGKSSRTYRSFCAAKARCQNPNHHKYNLYGGAGVEFRFDSFEDFLEEIGVRPEGKTLDRYPITGGHYEHGNVRWATVSEQNRGRQKYKWKRNRVLVNESEHSFESC